VGVEITHVPPARIGPLAERARELGADVVIVHGETLVEPVPKGTNRAAVEARVDILAHPGLITLDETKMAAEAGVLLEITSRKGHCLTNGHVAKVGREAGARFVIESDAHEPEDLLSRDFAERIGLGAGLSSDEIRAAFKNAEELLERERGR
jgi:histidinol phosphatase-like PHP family hydrolase